MSEKASLKEIAVLFFRLGTTAFGGPAAHTALMMDEVVRRKRWISKEEFMDLVGATQFIPGPNSTELAIHIGYRMGGWRGLFLAGSLFIMPAFFMVWFLAWAYVSYGSMDIVQDVFRAVMPVILAVIIWAVFGLTQTAVKNYRLLILSVFVAVGHFLHINDLVLLFGSALVYLASHTIASRGLYALLAALVGLMTLPYSDAKVRILPAAPLEQIFLYFVKVGSVLFGSGYVLFSFLHTDLVERMFWLTDQQLIDAVAVGQFTPGPVFTSATFVGYLLGGHSGAVLATVGIFLPAFFFVAITAPWLKKIRQWPWLAIFLDGLNAASLALIASTAARLGRDHLGYALQPWLVLIVSLILIGRYRVNSTYLVLALAIFAIARKLMGI